MSKVKNISGTKIKGTFFDDQGNLWQQEIEDNVEVSIPDSFVFDSKELQHLIAIAVFDLTEPPPGFMSDAPSFGGTASRPTSPTTGLMYFDTDLGIPTWYNGTIWIDAAGNDVT